MSNLLPPEEKKLVRREYRFRVVGVFLMLTCVAECLGVAFLLPAYIYSDTKRHNAEAEKKSMTQLKDDDQKVFVTLRTLGKQAEAAKLEARTPFSDTIKLVVAHAGNGLSIQSISFDSQGPQKHGLSVSGHAATSQVLLAFKNSMQAEPVVRSVDIPVSAFAEDQNISFTATINVEYSATSTNNLSIFPPSV